MQLKTGYYWVKDKKTQAIDVAFYEGTTESWMHFAGSSSSEDAFEDYYEILKAIEY